MGWKSGSGGNKKGNDSGISSTSAGIFVLRPEEISERSQESGE